MATRIAPLALILLLAGAASAATPADLEHFEKEVRPVLVERCQACHSTQIKISELDLSSAEGFIRGGSRGSLINSAEPGASLLLKVVSYDDPLKMPPTGKLSDEELALLSEWVERGAAWPGAETVAAIEDPAGETGFTAEQKTFWAFQPVKDHEAPVVKNDSWAKTPIDRFLLAKLEEAGIEPSALASKETLLRRASFDLTGLPPSEEDMAAFLADDSATAFEKAVDRMLASPRYGERWGRHWLDVARYADSTGNDEDHRYPYAWRYRDYVIEAFNEDLPYPEFVREQLAGDLLPSADGSPINRRGIIATGFLALGAKAIAQQDKPKMLADVYDEQIDVVSRAFLGLTLSCARCHDHKFDPLLQRDYYSMSAFFSNTRSFRDPSTHVSKLLFTPLVPGEEWDSYEKQQEEIRRRKFERDNLAEIEIEQFVSKLAPKVADYMLAAHKVYSDGAAADTAAAEAGLDGALLARWVDYLKPQSTVRIQLSEWREATEANRSAIATKYQQSFEETFAEWTKKLAKWRKEANRPAEEITMGIPAKPRFEPGENRFFAEVYMARRSSGPFSFKSKEDHAKVLQEETRQRIAQLEKEVAELEAKAMETPDRACAVEDKSAKELVQQHVFIRGDYHSKGEPSPQSYPVILAGFDQAPIETGGSGREQLADWIASPENPLAARVMVNRIWKGHFGRGIVATPSNFGKMGARPSHPELLDYLAARFVEDGWSVKKMHKRIMASAAYQQSSATTEAQAMKDSENLLLSHFTRRRLDVEEIHDGLLAIDGSIDLTVGGTMQAGFGTDRENSNDRLSLNPDEETRRLVYLPLRRANLPALLNLFDFGDATAPQGQRTETTVAPQALFMMNSKFVAERSANLARQLLEDQSADDAGRTRLAYRRVLSRIPSADEIDAGLTYVAAYRERFGDKADRAAAWASYCRILLASNEFIYVD